MSDPKERMMAALDTLRRPLHGLRPDQIEVICGWAHDEIRRLEEIIAAQTGTAARHRADQGHQMIGIEFEPQAMHPDCWIAQWWREGQEDPFMVLPLKTEQIPEMMSDFKDFMALSFETRRAVHDLYKSVRFNKYAPGFVKDLAGKCS